MCSKYSLIHLKFSNKPLRDELNQDHFKLQWGQRGLDLGHYSADVYSIFEEARHTCSPKATEAAFD